MTDTYIFHADPKSAADEGTEFDIQRRFIRALRKEAPTVKIVATPNGAKRTAWEKMRAGQEGMVPGWPDLNLYWSNGTGEHAIPGMAIIEFKDSRGSLSDTQIVQLNWLHQHGFPCGMFRSAATALAFLRKTSAPFIVERVL